MQQMKEFSLAKEKIIENYNKLIAYKLIPLKIFESEITEKSIHEIIENLKSEKFIVSVCGQIKAGKSMLLNDMIFGAETLPASDIPETAKITEITYGQAPEFTAFFYTKEEWEFINNQQVCLDGINGTYFDLVVNPWIKNTYEKNNSRFNAEEIIKTAQTASNDLGRLHEYISVNGRFTMLVKSIKIKYPAEILKNIIVIDTPGINDPDIYRGKITEKWISRSDAVIFLLSAAQPFTDCDREFFEKYLKLTAPEKILIAVSKIDVSENIEQAKNFTIKSIKKTLGDFGEKIIAGGDIYAVSPIFSIYPKLMARFEKGEITLSESKAAEIKYHLKDRVNESPFIKNIADNLGFMNQFSNEIQKKIINGSAQYIIKSHSNKIMAIIRQHIAETNAAIKQAEAKYQNVQKELQSINVNIETACSLINAYDMLKNTINERLKKINENFENENSAFIKKTHDETLKFISSCSSLKQIEANLYHEISRIAEDGFKNITDFFSLQLDALKSFLNNLNLNGTDKDKAEIIIACVRNASSKFFNNFDARNTLDTVKKSIELKINENEFQALRKYKFLFFLDTPKTVEALKSQIDSLFCGGCSAERTARDAASRCLFNFKSCFDELFALLEKFKTEALSTKNENTAISEKIKKALIHLDEIKAEGINRINSLNKYNDEFMHELKF